MIVAAWAARSKDPINICQFNSIYLWSTCFEMKKLLKVSNRQICLQSKDWKPKIQLAQTVKAAFSNCSHGAYCIMKVGGSIGTKSSMKNYCDKPVAELRRSPPLGRFAGSCGDGSIVARTAWELFRDFQGAAVVQLSGPGSMSLEARRVSISSHWTAGHGMSWASYGIWIGHQLPSNLRKM